MPPLPFRTVVRCFFNVCSFDSETNSLFPPLSFKKKNHIGPHRKIIPRWHWSGPGSLALRLQGPGVSWYASCTLLRMTVVSANVCKRLPLCVRGHRRPLAFSCSGAGRPRPAQAPFHARGSKSLNALSLVGGSLGPPPWGL